MFDRRSWWPTLLITPHSPHEVTHSLSEKISAAIKKKLATLVKIFYTSRNSSSDQQEIVCTGHPYILLFIYIGLTPPSDFLAPPLPGPPACCFSFWAWKKRNWQAFTKCSLYDILWQDLYFTNWWHIRELAESEKNLKQKFPSVAQRLQWRLQFTGQGLATPEAKLLTCIMAWQHLRPSLSPASWPGVSFQPPPASSSSPRLPEFVKHHWPRGNCQRIYFQRSVSQTNWFPTMIERCQRLYCTVYWQMNCF